MKKWLLLPLCATLLLALAACTNVEATIEPVQGVQYPAAIGFEDYEAQMTVREQNPVAESFLAAVNNFSYHTTASLLGQTQDNANYSPLSLYFALSLAAYGAGGDTQDQLLKLLGVDDASQLSNQCANLYRLLYTDNEISKLQIANSLWLDKDHTFKDQFVQNAATNFYAQAYTVDFSDQSTGQMMGQWIAEQTHGTLTPTFNFDSQQLMTILNTVYFYDQWTDRFDKSKTAPSTFHTAQGDVTVDFMHRTYGSAGYTKGAGFTRSSLGLKDSGSMVFILPDPGVTPAQLLSSAASVQELFEGGQSTSGEVVWQIPQFSFHARYDLAGTLKALGVTEAFESQADFSGITDGTAFISHISQETHIALDENGVEASAFTEIGYAGAAMPQGRAEMILDRPFIYGITASDGTLLFVGICADPSK